jgi:hypothetical protein
MAMNGIVCRPIVAILAVVFGATAVHSQGRIAQSGWEGFATPGADGRFKHCVLYNRTVEALNDSPYDMLGLSRDRAGAVGMLVFYRPRTLRRAIGVPVQLKFDQQEPFAVKGDVRSDFHVRVVGPLDPKLLDALRQAKSLTVTTQKRTEKFALADVGAVLDALKSCVKANAPQQGSSNALVEELVDLARGFGADAGDGGKISQRGTLDRPERAEVTQQRPLAGWADAGNLLQAGFADIALAPRPVRADGETVRLIAQPLDEIEDGIAWRQLERCSPGHKEGFAPGVAVRTLGDGNQRQIGDAKLGQRIARRIELTLPAIDQHEVGPERIDIPFFPLPIRERVVRACSQRARTG